jgi:hypothetical protein
VTRTCRKEEVSSKGDHSLFTSESKSYLGEKRGNK